MIVVCMAGRFFTWLEKKEKIACCTEEGNKGQHLYICPVSCLWCQIIYLIFVFDKKREGTTL